MNDIIELDYEDWCARFAPIQNPLNAHAPFEGCMFETFGPELAFVADQPAANVWTIVDEDGHLFVCEGFRFVNRLGYLITAKARGNAETVYVIDCES